MEIRAKEDSKAMLGRIPSPLSGYSALKEEERSSPLLECGLCIVTSLPRVGYGMRAWARVNSEGRKLASKPEPGDQGQRQEG